jgi:diguanylate cyclase (GGDEF)-like protein
VDKATGLYNSSFFRNRLEYSLARLKQFNLNHFTLLLADLADFETVAKQMDDEQSHALVREMAQILKTMLRPTDTVAHFEEARFAILVEDVRHWDIPIMLANRILEKMRRFLKEKGLNSYVNIGISLCHIGYGDVDHILQDAHTSLALAKAEGREGYKFYTEDNYNNAYDLDMIADMISLLGSEQVRGRPNRGRGIQVRPIEGPRLNILHTLAR